MSHYLKLQTNDDKLIMTSPDGVDELTVTVSTPAGKATLTLQRKAILMLAEFVKDKLKEMQPLPSPTEG